ncbi:TonB-dependent receptor [Cellvibrio polysaccharolyticus]|uniref:TonB-dependent receptor n=1 Tax=Cellvibrio polysaccharolyticus TaxID=2082724 RepID=A0A928V5N9_9GAMM|nr:TonB-dependent receptor [Cellvibrio polysaccharolyticus]MBE8717039.1 TonB-dependent receptor [Cellvibrio polysaccharolyticus]
MTYFKSSHAGSVHCTSIPFSRKKLAVGVASILMAAAGLTLIPTASTFAQETTTSSNAQNGEGVEEIIVSGIRFSQRSALDRKKESVTMSDSLVAEDIGEFPDKNIAEALSRIPGVQISRAGDGGEGSLVSVRGVSPDLLRVEVNSVGAMGNAGSREIDFRSMASELVKSLDVIKGSEARLTEGGIGGTIQVNTRKPNEFDDHYFSVSAEGQYNDLIGDVMPKFNITGVRKINDRLGVLLNVTASDKTTMMHAVRNTEWQRFDDYDNDPQKTTISQNPKFSNIANKSDCASSFSVAADRNECTRQWSEFSPYLPRYAIWERSEKRLSANAMVQFAVTDDLSVHAGYTFNERDKDAHDINLQFETESAARVNPESVVVDDRKNVVSFRSSPGARVGNRVIQQEWMQKNDMFETGFELKRDNIQLIGLLARSTADQDYDQRGTTAWASGVTDIQFTLDGSGLPHIDLSNAYIHNVSDPTDKSNKFDINSPASYTGGSSFNYRPSRDETQEDMGKLDFVFTPESGFFTKFQTGYQYTKQMFANWNWRYDINRNVGGGEGYTWTMDDQIALLQGNTTKTPKFFNNYSLDVPTLNSWQAVNNPSFLADLRAVSADNTTRADLNVQSGNFDVDLSSNAFYIQGNFETSLFGLPLKGNTGVRYVRTESDANGDVRIRVMVNELDENGNPMINPNTGGFTAPIEAQNHAEQYTGRDTLKNDYDDVLPSLNLTLGLIPDELELFFGIAKVMAQPRILDININANCTIYRDQQSIIDGTANVCTAGNPYLDPFRAKQMDIALTWYPNEDSVLSAAWFTKDITSWPLDPDTQFNTDFFGDNRQWDVRQKVNGGGAKTQGIELQASTIFTMLPAPFDGFGSSVNYTWMDSKDVGLFDQLTGAELPFPGQSENSYNITVFYETDRWSARVAYNYRDSFLQSAADRSGNPLYVDDAGYLDAKFNYSVNDNLKVYIDGKNLTGEVRSTNSGPGRMSSYDWTGREYAIGLSYRM